MAAVAAGAAGRPPSLASQAGEPGSRLAKLAGAPDRGLVREIDAT